MCITPNKRVSDNSRENFTHTKTQLAQAPDNLYEIPRIGFRGSMKSFSVKSTSVFTTNFILSCIVQCC
jgi:hypothetical protein